MFTEKISLHWVSLKSSQVKHIKGIDVYKKDFQGNYTHIESLEDSFAKNRGDSFRYYIKSENKALAYSQVKDGFCNNLLAAINEDSKEVSHDILGLVDGILFSSIKKKGAIADVERLVVFSLLKDKQILEGLYSLACKDYSTIIHSINVMGLTLGYTTYKKMSIEKIFEFCLGALFHDIGKLRVPDEILLSPKKLSESEFEIMKQHPLWGAEILQNYSGWIHCAIDAALDHHERWGGVGYPNGKKNISEIGQLLGIIDSYEAITNEDRIYQRPRSSINALNILKKEVQNSRLSDRIFSEFTESLVLY